MFRVSHDAWRFVDRDFAGPDGTCGGRWDDPDGTYRVCYAATSPLGAYLETLARFRPDPLLLAAPFIPDAAGDVLTLPPGVVPQEWFRPRFLLRGRVDGRFAVLTYNVRDDLGDVGSHDWV